MTNDGDGDVKLLWHSDDVPKAIPTEHAHKRPCEQDHISAIKRGVSETEDQEREREIKREIKRDGK